MNVYEAREEMLGRTKTVKVPTVSEAREIFTDHTFLIGSKFDKTVKKYEKQVMEVPTVYSNFLKFSEVLGAPAPKVPLAAPSLRPRNTQMLFILLV